MDEERGGHEENCTGDLVSNCQQHRGSIQRYKDDSLMWTHSVCENMIHNAFSSCAVLCTRKEKE